jgi:hypothetical protein
MPREQQSDATSDCDRFDREILPRVIAGEAPGAHVQECARCRDALAAHEALVHAVSIQQAEARPRPDWQARVLADVARGSTATRHPWRWSWWLGAATTALVVLLVFWRTQDGDNVSLSLDVRHQGGVRAGGQLAPGDVLVVHASTAGRPADLRVYRDERDLVFRCGVETPCRRARRGLAAEIKLPSVGRFRVLLVLDPPARALPGLSLDEDLRVLRDAGARVEVSGPVQVW